MHGVGSLIVSEISAKLSMFVGAWAGKSAHKGMNTYFINVMHGRHRRAHLIISLTISFGIATGLLSTIGFITIISATLAGLIMVGISSRNFGGMTGDVLGAMNELTRMVSLVAILVAARLA